jgi:hypothetical protein
MLHERAEWTLPLMQSNELIGGLSKKGIVNELPNQPHKNGS